jgi:hypothetical protein
LISWLAPYEGDLGDLEKVNLNQLKFFKMAEQGLENGFWATDSMISHNHTWTTQIPGDIKSGKYILRHELLVSISPRKTATTGTFQAEKWRHSSMLAAGI